MPDTVLRFSWNAWSEEILPAFLDARETASLDPLRTLIPSDQLDEERHILRGRRYLLFGPDERKLIGVGRLLADALRARADATLSIGDHAVALSEAVVASGACAGAAERFSRQIEPDRGLPPWMAGEVGPSLIPPRDVPGVLRDLEAFAGLDVIRDHADLEATVEELRRFFRSSADAAYAWLHRG